MMIEPTVQHLRNGEIDPLGRTITSGYVIAIMHRGSRVAWCDQIFLTEPAAEHTASACLREPYTVLPARRITYTTGKTPQEQYYRSTIVIDGEDEKQ